MGVLIPTDYDLGKSEKKMLLKIWVIGGNKASLASRMNSALSSSFPQGLFLFSLEIARCTSWGVMETLSSEPLPSEEGVVRQIPNCLVIRSWRALRHFIGFCLILWSSVLKWHSHRSLSSTWMLPFLLSKIFQNFAGEALAKLHRSWPLLSPHWAWHALFFFLIRTLLSFLADVTA